MSIVHIEHRSHWTGIANAMLEDHRLSLKARGLLAYLLTKPEGWQAQTTQLCHISDHDGRSAIYSALEELTTCGYATYEQPRDAGRFVKGGWTIRETPQTGFPLTENPDTEKPPTENRHLSKDLGKVKTEESKTQRKDPPLAPPVRKVAHTKKHEQWSTDYSSGFLALWTIYPHQCRVNKPACFAIWTAHALEQRTEEITEKIQHLLETTWSHTDPQYIPLTSTWFNNARWEDDLLPLPLISAQAITGMGDQSYQTAIAITNLATRRRANGEYDQELRSVSTGTRQVE